MAFAKAPPSSSAPAAPDAPERERRRLGDPLAPILALGRRQRRTGAVIGIAGALIVHAAPATQAVRSLADLHDFASAARDAIRERLKSELDVDLDRPPPPPPPPPPEPEPPPPAQQAQPKAPQEEPPPAPAQAAKVLTQEPDPNEPVDLTGEGFVTGNADRFAGGVTANTGTSTRPVRELNATPLGVPGGKGTSTAPVAPIEDRSRPAIHDTSVSWNDCGFTPEADLEGINEAVVVLAVTVGADGRARSVSVIKDPGFGFGRLARTCAIRKPFVVGLDRSGKPVSMTTAPFRVIFRR